MSAWVFESFNGSPLGEFIESPLHERNAEAVKNGYIYTGFDPERWVDDLWMYRYTADTWVVRLFPNVRKLIGRREGLESPAVNGSAYSMGGVWNPNNQLNVRAYRASTDRWSGKKEGPHTLMGLHAFQTYRGEIWGRINPFRGQPSRFKMWKYSPKTDKWKSEYAEKGSGTPNWFDMQSASIGDKGYYYGGVRQPGGNPSRPVDLHWRYSATDESYVKRAKLLQSIDRATGGGLDGWAFLMGGWDGQRTKATTRAYRPEKDSWQVWNGNQPQAAPMPGVRNIAASFILPSVNSIFVTGGATRIEGQDTVTDTNLRFDVKKDTWETMKKPIPSKRFKHGAFAI